MSRKSSFKKFLLMLSLPDCIFWNFKLIIQRFLKRFKMVLFRLSITTYIFKGLFFKIALKKSCIVILIIVLYL